MKLTKYIVSICLCLLAGNAFCCYWEPTPVQELFLFKTYHIRYDWPYYDNDMKESNLRFWSDYTKGRVPKAEVEKALYKSTVEEIDNGNSPFFRYLAAQKDTAALEYWRLVKRFAEKMDDPWYYYNLADRKELHSVAERLRTAGEKCTHQGLKERYLLQVMRFTFYLQDYNLCIQLHRFFPQTWQDSDIRERCLNYYAGALLHQGQTVAAIDIYSSTEDWNSLHTISCNTALLKTLYETNPRSRAFEFYIQQFLNREQFTCNPGERKEFSNLAKKVLKENKTDQPALWQSALAHIAFLDGDVKTAVTLIEKAANMKGSPLVTTNARLLRLLYHAADTKAANYDQRIATDLPWLLKKAAGFDCQSEYWGTEHYKNILKIAVFQYLEPHFSAKGRTNMALAVLNAYDQAESFGYDHDYWERTREYAPKYYSYRDFSFNYMDSTSIQNVKDFLAFVKSGGKTELEKGLIQSGYVNDDFVNELIGTKYMRLHDFHNAATYLAKVPAAFLKKQNIHGYLLRNPFKEAWISNPRERGHYGIYNPAALYAAQPTKLNFCNIMNELEKRMGTTTDQTELAQLHYAYSTGLMQIEDHCWAHLQYSSGYVYLEFEQANFEEQWDYKTSRSFRKQKALSHLNKAEALANDKELSARCCYMNLYIQQDIHEMKRAAKTIKKNLTGTRFHQNEMSHCDALTHYL